MDEPGTYTAWYSVATDEERMMVRDLAAFAVGNLAASLDADPLDLAKKLADGGLLTIYGMALERAIYLEEVCQQVPKAAAFVIGLDNKLEGTTNE